MDTESTDPTKVDTSRIISQINHQNSSDYYDNLFIYDKNIHNKNFKDEGIENLKYQDMRTISKCVYYFGKCDRLWVNN